ncbi:MAG: hypothetical protein IPG73_13370 [Ignavibacteria bacterium]|nr:hypothetical protein [Ignavibacteria bacterium]MBK7412680.1 hypothetical protein [Ignavibacteria bacterium]
MLAASLESGGLAIGLVYPLMQLVFKQLGDGKTQFVQRQDRFTEVTAL